MDIKIFYKQVTVNYLLNPEKWTRPKVNTERSQMNNKDQSLGFIYDLPLMLFGKMHSVIGCDKIRTIM